MVQEIVQEVMAKMQIADAPAGKHGVFKDMNDAIEAAKKAQQVVKTMSMDQREKIITCIRKKIKENAEVLARMGVEETGMGNVGDKILKHHLVADKTPGTEDITTTAWSGDRGLTLIEMGPFGVIGAITPCTNPSETILCNTMGMLAGGNTVVFNPHPAAIKTSIYAINLLNEASLESGGPDNIAVTVEKPTLETSNVMMKHKDIPLIAATGGPGVVTAVLSSGKRGIGAGAGNPPALVDETADVRKAATDIVNGCTFDNNLPCIAEKESVAVSSIVDELMHYLVTENDCYLASKEEQDKLTEVVLAGGKLNRKCVGRDARTLLSMIGVNAPANIRCIVFEGPKEHPLITTELMMPILGVVRARDFDDAVEQEHRENTHADEFPQGVYRQRSVGENLQAHDRQSDNDRHAADESEHHADVREDEVVVALRNIGVERVGMRPQSRQLPGAHGDFSVVLLKVAPQPFRLLEFSIPDKLESSSVVILHNEVPGNVSHRRNRHQSCDDVFPGHPSGEHHADEYKQEHQCGTCVALYHDNPERNHEMRAQQQEMRQSIHLIAQLGYMPRQRQDKCQLEYLRRLDRREPEIEPRQVAGSGNTKRSEQQQL